MIHRARTFWHALILLCLVLAFSGCSGSEANRYYLLKAEAPQDPSCLGTPSGPDLGVGPVKIPDYLNRYQIVSRTTGSGVIIAQFDRWAEPLDSGISRVMAEDLSRLLCARTIHLFPWKAGTAIDYRVEAEILRLDGTAGGEAVLDAQWSVSRVGQERKVLMTRIFRVTEKTGQDGYDGIARAHNSMIGLLNREIAAGITELRNAGPGAEKR